jgi:hypothetical protein
MSLLLSAMQPARSSQAGGQRRPERHERNNMQNSPDSLVAYSRSGAITMPAEKEESYDILVQFSRSLPILFLTPTLQL